MDKYLEFLLQPFQPCHWIDNLTVRLTLEQPDLLFFQIALKGDPLFLAQLPETQPGKRACGLWEETCFELFIGLDNCPGYIEWNLAATGDWNCFSFHSERTGMLTSDLLKLHSASSSSTPRGYLMNCRIQLSESLQAIIRQCCLGVAAVLKSSDSTAYFALAHGLQADFHDRRYHQQVCLS